MDDLFDDYGRAKKRPAKANKNVEEIKKPVDPYDTYLDLTQQSNKSVEDEVISKTNQISEDETTIEKEINPEKETLNIDELVSELDDLIGLNRVKSEIKTLLQFVKVQELRRKQKISISKPNLHSVFYGSPGTGKTTVARLYGQMLNALGLLSKGHLVETDRSGLVGGYVGQTAIKVDEKIKEALGGVLFIDEAYALSKGNDVQWDYGEEAIAILLKRMEDFRDDLVVIVAGYPEPMGRFLHSNEGLKSRFSTYIYFDDYSPQEMAEIFSKLCVKENYAPTQEAIEFVFSAIDYNYSIRDKSFGNARYVRNLFEVVIKNQAFRIGTTINNPTPEELRMILPSDIPFVIPSDTKGIQQS